MDITPSPRLLQMLGEIEFDEWQCIAELIDNSFDSFLEIKKKGAPWPGGFKVEITLPSQADDYETAKLVIKDSGPGMGREQMEKAVKAGFSSNDRFTKLGLFGMGFNVSTARLGGYTKVTSARTEDILWNSVEIDFDKIDDSFAAPESQLEKDYLSEHGTIIEIGKLKPERLQFLTKHKANLKLKLGQVYSFLLQEHDFQIVIDGEKIKPQSHCTWSELRSVDIKFENGFESVPAIIRIDKKLTSVDSCQDCGSSSLAGQSDSCPTCGSSFLVLRERRIWGWLGIQRYLSPNSYGIDFLRNGRKILMGDRRLFEWKDPNDPIAVPFVEYPTELAHQGGRVVGEIHVDHIPVTYSKDAFEYSDKAWKHMVELIRGEGPIRPKRAKGLGYSENISPLAKLCRAYAETKPGLKNLMPGDGSQAIHATTRDWGKKFSDGIEDYQSDQKWWDAILEHERISSLGSSATQKTNPAPDVIEGSEDIFGEFDLPADEKSEKPATGRPASGALVETQEERISRLASGPRVASLSRDISVPSLQQSMSLTTHTVNANGQLLDTAGKFTAVWLVPGNGHSYQAFIDLDHALFLQGFEPYQILAFEIARHLLLRSGKADQSPSLTASEIINSYFKEAIPSAAGVRLEAARILREVKVALSSITDSDFQRVLNVLAAADQQAMEDEMILANVSKVSLQSQESLEFLPALTVLKLMEEVPDLFFDGLVFDVEYAGLGSENAKFITKSKFTSLLADLALVAVGDGALAQATILRANLSARLLSALVVG